MAKDSRRNDCATGVINRLADACRTSERGDAQDSERNRLVDGPSVPLRAQLGVRDGFGPYGGTPIFRRKPPKKEEDARFEEAFAEALEWVGLHNPKVIMDRRRRTVAQMKVSDLSLSPI